MVTGKLEGVLEVVPEPLGEGTTESTHESFPVTIHPELLRVVMDVTALATHCVGSKYYGPRLILRRAVQLLYTGGY